MFVPEECGFLFQIVQVLFAPMSIPIGDSFYYVSRLSRQPLLSFYWYSLCNVHNLASLQIKPESQGVIHKLRWQIFDLFILPHGFWLILVHLCQLICQRIHIMNPSPSWLFFVNTLPTILAVNVVCEWPLTRPCFAWIQKQIYLACESGGSCTTYIHLQWRC